MSPRLLTLLDLAQDEAASPCVADAVPDGGLAEDLERGVLSVADDVPDGVPVS